MIGEGDSVFLGQIFNWSHILASLLNPYFCQGYQIIPLAAVLSAHILEFGFPTPFLLWTLVHLSYLVQICREDSTSSLPTSNIHLSYLFKEISGRRWGKIHTDLPNQKFCACIFKRLQCNVYMLSWVLFSLLHFSIFYIAILLHSYL